MRQGILLTVDYHDQNCVVRSRDLAGGTEDVRTVPTTPGDLLGVVAEARKRVGRSGRVIWVQESTTSRPKRRCSTRWLAARPSRVARTRS